MCCRDDHGNGISISHANPMNFTNGKMGYSHSHLQFFSFLSIPKVESYAHFHRILTEMEIVLQFGNGKEWERP